MHLVLPFQTVVSQQDPKSGRPDLEAGALGRTMTRSGSRLGGKQLAFSSNYLFTYPFIYQPIFFLT